MIGAQGVKRGKNREWQMSPAFNGSESKSTTIGSGSSLVGQDHNGQSTIGSRPFKFRGQPSQV